MPTQAEVIDDIDNELFDDAKAKIAENPELINAIDPWNGNHLLYNATGTCEQDIIDFVLNHPKMNHLYINPKNKQSILELVVDTPILNVDTVKLAYKAPEQLINNGILCFELAVKNMDKARTSFLSFQQQDPNSKKTTNAKKRLSECEEISEFLLDQTIKNAKATPALREALILFGIKKDDAELFTRLYVAGLKPSSMIGKSGEEQLPRSLLKPFNTKLTSWFDAQLNRCIVSITDNPSSFYNRAKQAESILSNIKELDAQFEAAKAAIYVQHMKQSVKRIENLIEDLTPPRL